MVPRWLLIAESVLLGLMILLAAPVWALIPMLFGVRESTPRAAARRVYVLLALFPVVAVGTIATAWLTDPRAPSHWILVALPLCHLLLLLAARVRG